MLTELVAAGGETDTIAAIGGNVAGAMIGQGALPAEYLAAVSERALLESIGSDMAQLAGRR